MKKTLRAICLIVALVMMAAVVFTACEQPKPLTMSETELTVKIGKTAALKVENATEAVVWSSSNEDVATVDQEGLVTALDLGKATITAKAGEESVTCEVTVVAADAITKTYVNDGKNYTSHDYMNNTPSNWNEMDYQSNDDTAILGWIGSSFFGYDYALIDESQGRVTADGKLNVDNLDFSKHIVTYEAATALKDVTADYADEWGLTATQKTEGGYIWRITLRDDLAWDDGTAIFAKDFVYSMKEQLNYLLQPFRADTYWAANGMKIHNAKNYYYQGRTVTLPQAVDLSALEKNDDGQYMLEDGTPLLMGIYDPVAALSGDSLGMYLDALPSYFDPTAMALVKSLLDENGRVPCTDETYAAVGALGAPFGAGPADFAPEFVFATQSFDEMTFDEVGIFSEGNYDIIVVLDQKESWIRDDGSLSYTISNCSLPLVKESLYESLKQEPIAGSEKWTTTYNTTVETSASWGPYRLAFFQTDKQFILQRNEYWYGYGLEEYKDQYLTDSIVVDVIQETEAQKMAFWKGEIDSIAFDSLGTDAITYEKSDYALFTPSSSATAYGIQIYSNLAVLKKNGQNNGILGIRDFRWALSLAFDREAFISDQLFGLQLGLGLLGPGYYYDPEESLSYRDSEQAKAALLRTYGFELNGEGKWTDGVKVYKDIDDATEAMTGYNLTKAKEKLALAIAELEANPEKYAYDPSQPIKLRLGKFNAKGERRAQLLQECINKLVEGSSLEGKIEVVVVETNASQSADEFRDGKFELYVIAGIGGAVFYPFNTMDNYLGFGSLSYHTYMDPKAELTMTMPAGDYAKAGEEVTLTTQDWFNSLNGKTAEKPCSYNWGEGNCPLEVRLEILAMLEEYALSQHHTIQVANDYVAALQTAKYSNISDTYHTFMGLGGSRYIRYNFTDEEWADFVASHNGDLSDFYKGAAN